MQHLRRLASGLKEFGLGPRDHVAIIARTRPEWHLIEHAALMCGGVVVGIDPHIPKEHLERVLDTVRPKILVHECAANGTASTMNHSSARTIFVNRDLTARGGRGLTWEQFEEFANSCPRSTLPNVASSDPATLIFTSGTTGFPKAIQFDHGQLMIACQAICDAFPKLQTGDASLCWLPMAHLFQRMMNLVAVAHGAAIHFVDDPKRLAECAKALNPSLLIGVPRFFEKLRERIESEVASLPNWQQRMVQDALRTSHRLRDNIVNGRRAPYSLRLRHALLDRTVLARIRRSLGRRLRFMITGSAPISESHLEFFADLGCPVYEAYGVSECAIPIAANRPQSCRIGTVGIPFAENGFRLADDGEILVSGPATFKGYWGESCNTEFFSPDGFYRTGDLGQLDSDGYLRLLGRKSDMLKTSTGRKVFPTAIERVYQEHPLIDQIVVFGEGRPYLVGLVSVNIAWLRQEVVSTCESVDERLRIDDGMVDRLLHRALCEIGLRLAPHERVVNFAVVPEGFKVEAGEVTTNMKLRRSFIGSKYASQIAQMYNEPHPLSVASRQEEVGPCLMSS